MADIKVRVGQNNSVKIISSVSGSTRSVTADNVIGGIASVSQLTVTGLSTFTNNVYIDGNLYVTNDLVFDEFLVRNGNVTGILTVGQTIYYGSGEPYGIAYFDPSDRLVSTGTTATAISETNYILSTNSSGIPSWSNVIDGGEY